MVDIDPEQESDVNRHDEYLVGLRDTQLENIKDKSLTLYYKTHYNTPGEVI